MADVVVCHRARALGRQRQAQLCAFEGLALAFLIAAQHQRLVGRIEIEADHVPEFLFEARVVRQLEGLHAVRLDVILRPDALHRTRRNASVPAIERILQRLLPCGGRVASVMTRATFAAEIEALRPRPGSSASPSRPDLAKRVDHIETRFDVVLSRSATASTPRPSMRSRMMLARSRSRIPIVVDRERRRSSAITSGSACSRLIGRAILATPSIDAPGDC